MFKLVIVEDEDNIRHSLECFIPWNEMGFQVINTFSDGSDALAFLKDNPCDAVLTDIRMSRMSGLEMIQQLHQIQPDIKTVILSGYSDFAYAQQAITYKVTQYLVKPVDEEELIAVFKGIKQQLDYEWEELTAAESEKRNLKQLLQKSFFRDLLLGRVGSSNELDEYIKLLDIAQVKKDSQLLAFEIKIGNQEKEETFAETDSIGLEDAFKKQIADDDCCMFPIEEKHDQWSIVCVGQPWLDNERFRELCHQKLQQLAEELNSECKFHQTHSAAQLSDLLTATDEPLQEKQTDASLCERVLADYKLLVMEMDLGCLDSLKHILVGVIRNLADTPLEEVQFILKNLYAVIEMNYKKRKISVWDITGGKFNFNHVYQAQDMEEIEQCVVQDFSALCDGLKDRKQESEHTVIERIVAHLQEHIDEDISHDVIAAKYRIHPGYLSRLFKQEMGETLSEYILRIKIERAAALLKQGKYKIGEIASMVGYSAPSYFSIIFKKYTGHSPREYSQRISL